MFTRTLEDVQSLGRVKFPADGSFRSARYAVAADGLGFSYNENSVKAGWGLDVWLKNHWEANYIVSGRAEVTDLSTDETWGLEAGSLYVVGPNDRHHLKMTEDEVHLSVFCPPLTGEERFDEDGSYEASGPIEKTDKRMFLRRLEDMQRDGHELVVAQGKARTVRMVTKADGVGFSLSAVHMNAGAETDLWYKHHWEANHILSGAGEVADLTTGETWPLSPGTAYYVGPKDRHRLRATEDMHFISVFCPPLFGNEQHDEDGSYPPSGPTPPGPANIAR